MTLALTKPAIDLAATTIQTDPEFRSLIPLLTDDERNRLEANLKADGCRDPLAVWQGILLDGHNRLAICQEHGIDYRTVEIDLPDHDAAKRWIVDNQIGRRNLTPFQRVELVLWLEPSIAARSQQGERTDLFQKSGKSEHLNTHKQLAAIAGVSHDTIAKAKVLAEHVSGEIKDKLRAGATSINKEYKFLRMRLARQQMADDRAAAVVELPHGENIVTGDFRTEGLVVADDSVDVIFTDSPYNSKDAIGIYADLGQFAARVLRPGGLLFAYCGTTWIPHSIGLLSEHLEYGWTFISRHTQGCPVYYALNIRDGYKPIAFLYKPPLNCWWNLLHDILDIGRREKDLHPWQQAEGEAAYFIEHLCPAGGMVIDPMCGSGTTLAAAKRLGRQYLGFEIDPGVAAAARKRVAE